MNESDLINQLNEAESESQRQQTRIWDLEEKIQIPFTLSLGEFRQVKACSGDRKLMEKMQEIENRFLKRTQ